MLRNALALSTVTGNGFRIENIRGSRPEPGLKRQHLEAVKTVARIASADVEGAELGSTELVFCPDDLSTDPFTANIGTAGSVNLLFDAVLPVTTQFNTGFRLTGKGGTDVKWSPTSAYYERVKLPLLAESGFKSSYGLSKTGFYPKGGGEVVLETAESSMTKIDLAERGGLQKFKIYSKASRSLQDAEVADRQADETALRLKKEFVSTEIEKNVDYVESASPGSMLCVKAEYENSIAGFDALGERGKRAENVAQDAVEEFLEFHESGAAVDPYMADQLIIFLAIVGGEVSIPEITDHIQTAVSVAESFGKNIEILEGERIVLSG